MSSTDDEETLSHSREGISHDLAYKLTVLFRAGSNLFPTESPQRAAKSREEPPCFPPHSSRGFPAPFNATPQISDPARIKPPATQAPHEPSGHSFTRLRILAILLSLEI